MDRTFLAVTAASVVLLAAGIAGGAYLTGSGLFDQQPRVDPAVTTFDAADPVCVTDPDTTPVVDIGNTTRGSFLVIRANLSVAGPDTTIENATLAGAGLANYTLTYVPGTEGDASCPDGEQAVVRTQTSFQVPHPGGEPFGVTVRYDDETLFRLRNTPNGLQVRNATA